MPKATCAAEEEEKKVEGPDDDFVSNESSKNYQYVCKICKNKRFKHSSALGGHISKAHPGQSSAYNHKKHVRETRELERSLHKHTMQIYNETYR